MSDVLRTRLATVDPHPLCVAFSGGPDSTALLHALAQLPEARRRGLRALHVDHGLHPDSAGWCRHCAAFCDTFDVPFTGVRVNVIDTRGEGLESAARRARYAAFGAGLQPGEWLVLGHHRDDQVETVLLKLLRGAGPEGLGGMPRLRRLARGAVWRPLLDVPRAALRHYLTRCQLNAIDDPANADPRFARNVLRNEVLPTLAKHFPLADRAILHTAARCRVAAAHIAGAAATALPELARANRTLDAAGWLALPDAVRAPALDAWLRAHALPVPPDDARAELERQARTAAHDRVPRVRWERAEVRIWDGRLHAGSPLPDVPANWQADWTGAPLTLPDGCGWLELAGTRADTRGQDLFDPPLRVRLRRGGERIRPVGSPHIRQLRTLFQTARIPPWLRTRCPLIYASGELIAVAGWWLNDAGWRAFSSRGVEPRWHAPHPAPKSAAIGVRRP